eukprot:GILJ01010531.1.p1 GENE.GILJ01010531.1~~GILJ01010531.1.p1  ORF type:complete len:2063 (+),score=307.09 GILJ01010531.1:68-6256(+)
MTEEVIRKIPLFRGVGATVVDALAYSLDTQVYSPGDDITKEGSVINFFYILSRGHVDVLVNGEKQSRMDVGEWFGEVNLFSPQKCTSTNRAGSYCETFRLTKDRFDTLIKPHLSASVLESLQQEAEKKIKQAQKMTKLLGNTKDLHLTHQLHPFYRHFLPNSPFRRSWLVVIFTGLMYCAVMSPLSLMYFYTTWDEFDSIRTSFFTVDYIMDLVFLADIVLQARFFAFREDGVLKQDPALIFQKYKKSSLYYDVVGILPLDVLVLIPGIGFRFLPLLRLNRILRLSTLFQYTREASDYLQSKGIHISEAAKRVTKLFFCLCLLCHWIGCGWAYIEHFDTTGNNWKHIEEHKILYLRAVYWATTLLTTTGYGDIFPHNTLEMYYALFSAIIGALVTPALIGAMASLMSKADPARLEFKIRTTELDLYMAYKQVPDELKKKVNTYYEYLWSRQRGVNEVVILNDLPTPLRMQVASFVNRDAVKKVALFEKLDSDVISYILSLLRPCIFLPGDNIVTAGTPAKDLFFLKKGTIKVVAEDGNTVLAVIGDGVYFGETALVKPSVSDKRIATVKAVTCCDCFVLETSDFQKVIEYYPDFNQEEFEKWAAARIQQSMISNRVILNNITAYNKLDWLASKNDSFDSLRSTTHLFYPDGRFRLFWDLICLILVIYQFCVVFYRAAFLSDLYSVSFDSFVGTIVVDYIIDCFFLVDMYMRDKKFVIMVDGELVIEPAEISKVYRDKSFKFDLLMAFPYEIFASIGGGSVAWSLTRIPKTFRIFRAPLYAAWVERRVEKLSVGFVRVFKMLTVLALSSHLVACIFYLVDRFSDEPGWVAYQIAEHLYDSSPDIGTIYLSAYYWALSALSLVIIKDVDPITNLETAFCIITLYYSVFLQSLIIGTLEDLLSSHHSRAQRHREKLDELDEFITLTKAPEELESKLRAFYEFEWSRKRGFEESDLLMDLPSNLRAELELDSKLQFVEQSALVNFCPDKQSSVKMATALVKRVYGPREWIIRKGEISNDVYFIFRGSADVIYWKEGKELSHFEIRSYDYFGELALLSEETVGFDVQAINYCEVYVLQGAKLKQIWDEPLDELAENLFVLNTSGRFGRMRNLSNVDMIHEDDFVPSDDSEYVDASDTSNPTSPVAAETAMKRRKSSGLFSANLLDLPMMRNPQRRYSVVAPASPEPMNRLSVEPSSQRRNSSGYLRRNSIQATGGAVSSVGRKSLVDRVTLTQSYPAMSVQKRDDSKQSRSRKLSSSMDQLPVSFSVGLPSPTAEVKRHVTSSFVRLRELSCDSDSSVASATSTDQLLGSPNVDLSKNRLFNFSAESPPNSVALKGRSIEMSSVNSDNGSPTAVRTGSPISLTVPKPPSSKNVKYLTPSGSQRNLVRRHNIDTHTSFTRRSSAAFVEFVSKVLNTKRYSSFDPDSWQRFTWDLASFIMAIYFAVMVPLRIAFFGDDLSLAPMMTIDYLFDFFFWIDMFMNARRFTVVIDGSLITEEGELTYLYIRSSRFMFDLICNCPLDIFALATGGGWAHVYAFRLNKLIRVVRMVSFFQHIDRFLAKHVQGRVNLNLLKVCQMIFLYLLMAHVFGCAWFVVHRYLEQQGYSTPTTPTQGFQRSAGLPMLAQYFNSIFHAFVTVPAVGTGAPLSTLLQITLIFNIVCLRASLVGMASVYFEKKDTTGSNAFRSRIRNIQRYIEYRNLPVDVSQKILNHFDFVRQQTSGFNPDTMLSTLPEALQMEVMFHMCKHVISKIPIMAMSRPLMQKQLAMVIKPQIFNENETIYSEGETATDVYFIVDGKIEISQQGSDYRAVKTVGDYFGNMSKREGGGSERHFSTDSIDSAYSDSGNELNPILVRRNNSAVAKTRTEVYSVTREAMDNVIKKFPDLSYSHFYTTLFPSGSGSSIQTPNLNRNTSIANLRQQNTKRLELSRLVREGKFRISVSESDIQFRPDATMSPIHNSPSRKEKTEAIRNFGKRMSSFAPVQQSVQSIPKIITTACPAPAVNIDSNNKSVDAITGCDQRLNDDSIPMLDASDIPILQLPPLRTVHVAVGVDKADVECQTDRSYLKRS